MTNNSFPSRYILGTRVDALNYSKAVSLIIDWANRKQSRYVCVPAVHMIMEGYDSKPFQDILNNADLVTPDGMPVVFALKMMGVNSASRVYGPTLTLKVCEAAAKEGIKIGLYGGTTESLNDFKHFLWEKFPNINIVCAISPPFRELTAEENARYVDEISSSGVQILFVGIGCPKQERWMSKHKERLSTVMVGVGATFDFHSGRVRQAPTWVQNIGMEWFFRLMMEPRRLFMRHAKHNPRYLILLAMQLVARRFGVKLWNKKAENS